MSLYVCCMFILSDLSLLLVSPHDYFFEAPAFWLLPHLPRPITFEAFQSQCQWDTSLSPLASQFDPSHRLTTWNLTWSKSNLKMNAVGWSWYILMKFLSCRWFYASSICSSFLQFLQWRGAYPADTGHALPVQNGAVKQTVKHAVAPIKSAQVMGKMYFVGCGQLRWKGSPGLQTIQLEATPQASEPRQYLSLC